MLTGDCSEGLPCNGRTPRPSHCCRRRPAGLPRPVNQQSGSTRSDMAERFTGPSRDRMEWLCKPGPSADNVRGHFTGTQSEPTRAPPALIEKKASPRLTTDGLDGARSMDRCAIGCSLTDYVWGKLKPALSGVISIRARGLQRGRTTNVVQDGLGDIYGNSNTVNAMCPKYHSFVWLCPSEALS